jgi:hypothetical protein
MLTLASAASAETSVAILDFELNDITGLRAPEEQRRTASLAPLLRDAMSQMNGYDLTAIEPDAQVRANAGVGYPFNQPEAAAALAEASGAKWVVAGMLQRSSYLFAYVTVRVSNVTTKQLIGEFNTRLEGPMTDDRITRRGMHGSRPRSMPRSRSDRAALSGSGREGVSVAKPCSCIRPGAHAGEFGVQSKNSRSTEG